MFNFDKSAIIIVDVQNDFCEQGSLQVEGASSIIPIINQLVKLPWKKTIYTQDYHPQDHISFFDNHLNQKPFTTVQITNKQVDLWPRHCVQGTKGVEFHPELQISENNSIYIKKGTLSQYESYSGFGCEEEDTQLFKLLKQNDIQNLYITGLAQDYCVFHTVKDGLKKQFQVYLVKDATVGVSKEQCQNQKNDLLKQYANYHEIESKELLL